MFRAASDQHGAGQHADKAENALGRGLFMEKAEAHEGDEAQAAGFPEGKGHADGQSGSGPRKAVIGKADSHEHDGKAAEFRVGEGPRLGEFEKGSAAYFQQNSQSEGQPVTKSRFGHDGMASCAPMWRRA